MIRIGCETHNIDIWKDEIFQNHLAEKYNEIEWWNKRGKKILDFLMENPGNA